MYNKLKRPRNKPVDPARRRAPSPPAFRAPPADADPKLLVWDTGPANTWWKGPLERLAAALLLLLLSPLVGFLVCLVRWSSPGPALFQQERVGLRGRRFTMLKLRTMIQDAEKTTGPVWAQKSDPRVTPVGGFLRRTHLDELPQLINIVRGEMSFVGPRPERPEFVAELAGKIPEYLYRLDVLPGVTGLAQVRWPPDLTVECVRRKLASDLEYARRAGIVLDARILSCTALQMVLPRRPPLRWFGLNPLVAKADAHGAELGQTQEDSPDRDTLPPRRAPIRRAKTKPR